jgi:formylglycine-generating enzyme
MTPKSNRETTPITNMKNPSILCSHFIVLAVLAAVHPVAAEPALTIAPAGNQSVMYWPAIPGTNIAILQGTTNLASPNWVTANDAVPVTAVTVSNTSRARYFRLISTNPPAGMAFIPAGFFTIGNSIGDSDISDLIPTNVYVSAFYMDVNLVSYGLWTNVYDNATSHGYGFNNAGEGKNYETNQPIQTVDWYDCVKWCNARSQSAGLTPVYYTDAGLTQVYKSGQVTNPFVNWSANGFRLPTEAEWEKAARGGLSGRRFPWGNRIDQNQANYYGNTNSYSYDLGPDDYNAVGSIDGTWPATSPVGSFDVNGYGLYDMAGNVMEWCWDWYGGTPFAAGSPYLGGSNPQGVGPGSDLLRVLRGGYWSDGANLARCANRRFGNPSFPANDVGFRCVAGL